MNSLSGKILTFVRYISVCIFTVSAIGCAEVGNVPRLLPTTEVHPELPGVTSPADRIAQLKELSEDGRKSSPDEQHKIAEELATAIRTEADPMIRAEIVRTLGEYPTERSEEVLRAALADPDEDVRIAACRAWAKRGNAEAVEVLGRVLAEDADVDVRLTAAWALGQSKEPTAVAALEPALADQDPAMQYRAVLSLRKITGQNLGNDVSRWQQYVRGETPKPAEPISIAERLRQLF